MHKPMKLPYKSLKGFSEDLISDHYKIYLGYIDRFGKLESLLSAALKAGDKFTVARLAREDGFLRNAIRLHELYFGNLTPGGKGSANEVLGSMHKLLIPKLALMAAGAHGWAILGVDLPTGEIFTFTMQEHSQGYVEQSWPILVLDCYEHAWWTDYRLDKPAYIEAFFKNVDWPVVNRRLHSSVHLGLMTR
jgi:Fe-Mn family superoxide dismutase